MDENGSSLIADWFRHQVVFVTGSTGFMGKVLVEKLLRDCPEIEKCYLLMRTKRGIEPEQRRDDYVNNVVSDNQTCIAFLIFIQIQVRENNQFNINFSVDTV